MKDRSVRTKVVIRQLPPSLVQSDLIHQIDDRFAGRYNWFSFRPGKNSHKHQRYSRAYIDFKCPEDVFEFAEFFDGHVFVNEKGSQHKAMVEYAPFQCVPKAITKKDGREGTIYKDPDFLEFLKLIAHPPEHLPSAEIQLERKEAEQAGAAKENTIVTPLMEYVRQKRVVESGKQASSIVAKVSRRGRAASPGKSSSAKRGSEKKKYVQKVKNANRKDKSAFVVVPRREDQTATSIIKGISGIETLHGIEGPISKIPLTADGGKKKFLLLKGKERDMTNVEVTDGVAQQKNIQSAGNSPVPSASKQNQRREAGGRLIRSILLNNEAHQSQSTAASQQKIQILSSENGKRPSRHVNAKGLGLNGIASNHDAGQVNFEGDSKRASDEKFIKRDPHGMGTGGEKNEKRTRNKDRPDRGVWTPLRRSDVSHSRNEHLSSSVSQPNLLNSESVEGPMKDDVQSGSKSGELTASAGGRNIFSTENGSQRHFTRRGAAHLVKDDGMVNLSEGKHSKRAVAGQSVQEKQVWVQKSSSGS